MAVSKVKIASIIGVTDKLDDVIRLCGQTQYFHPDDALFVFIPIPESSLPLQTRILIQTSSRS